MTESTCLGGRLPSIDGVHKATGATRFGDDIRVGGMLHGAIVGSPHPHARIVRVDCGGALRLPGVRAVLTGADVPEHRHGQIVPDQHILARDRVRFVGDPVAAVAADTSEIAAAAAQLVAVEYEPLPSVFTPEEALIQGAPVLHGDTSNAVREYTFSRGDPDSAWARAVHVFDQEFHLQPIHHAYLEPSVCTAEWTSGTLTLMASNQYPFRERGNLARALGLDEAQIRVVQTHTGGAFGGKVGQRLYSIAAVLAKAADAPVRVALNREQEFTTTRVSVPMKIRLRTGLDAEGRFLVKETEILADSGGYAMNAPAVVDTAAVRIDSLYQIPTIRTSVRLVYTNNTPTGSFRGFGSQQMTFAMESQMDDIAHRLGMDPVDLRLRNATQCGDVTVHGWRIGSCGLSECIDEAVRLSGWTASRTRPPLATPESPLARGLGMACCIHVSGRHEDSEAEVWIDGTGTVTLRSAESDLGQGARTVLCQIVGEVLSTPYDAIVIDNPDTGSHPFTAGAFASRTTTIGGGAVMEAALELRGRLIDEAACVLGVRSADVRLSEGRLASASDGRAVTLGEAAAAALQRSGERVLIGRATRHPDTGEFDPVTLFGNQSVAYSFACQVAEVEVDTETGQTEVVNFYAVHDSGQIINLHGAEGQVEGGVVQGVGYGLFEEVQRRDGRVLNPDFRDYKLATALDAPPVSAHFIDTVEPEGPFGAKGLGELVAVPGAPAIANAIFNATGVRVRSLPITPERLLGSLRAQSVIGEPV